MAYGIPEFPKTQIYDSDLKELIIMYRKLFEEIDAIKADIAEIKTQIADLYAKWDTIDEKIKDALDMALADFMAEIDEKIAVVEKAIADLDKKLSEEIADISATVAALENTMQTVTTDITNIKTQLTAINTDITNIHSQLATIGTDIANIKTQLGTITTDITNIKNDIANLEAEDGQFLADITAMQEDIENAQSSLSELSTKAASLQTNVTSLDERVTALENASVDLSEYAKKIDIWTGNNQFKFGVDAAGNYGYYKAGADTVTPFKSDDGFYIISSKKTDYLILRNNTSTVRMTISGISKYANISNAISIGIVSSIMTLYTSYNVTTFYIRFVPNIDGTLCYWLPYYKLAFTNESGLLTLYENRFNYKDGSDPNTIPSSTIQSPLHILIPTNLSDSISFDISSVGDNIRSSSVIFATYFPSNLDIEFTTI